METILDVRKAQGDITGPVVTTAPGLFGTWVRRGRDKREQRG